MFYIPYAWLNIKKKLLMQWAIEKVRESDDGSSWKQMCARWKILWEIALYNRHSVFVESTSTIHGVPGLTGLTLKTPNKLHGLGKIC